jgi:cobalt-zinc-cadmium efflux system outer membrane protein
MKSVHSALVACLFSLASVAPGAAQTRPPRAAITLSEVLDSVALRHPLVQAAAARARAARGELQTAGVVGNPLFMYQVENARLPGGQPVSMDREDMTTLTFPLEALYQRRPMVRRAQAGVRAAEAEAIAERRRVALDAAHAFYRTALAQIELEAARDLASWLDTVVTYNRTRVKEGVTAEADLIRSELERDRAYVEVTMQEAEAAQSRATLAAFLGDTSFSLPGLEVAAPERPLPVLLTRTPTAVARQALGVRPEMDVARERLNAGNYAITTQRALRLRNLGATLGTKRSAGMTSLMAGVALPLPLFDQNRGEVARVVAERDAAAFELAAQERSVRAEVAATYEAARLLTARASTLAQRENGYLDRADEARRIALGAYREGAIPLIQVLDAARAWGEARVAFYRVLYGQHESVLNLISAEGEDLGTALTTLEPTGASAPRSP